MPYSSMKLIAALFAVLSFCSCATAPAPAPGAGPDLNAVRARAEAAVNEADKPVPPAGVR